MGAYLIRRLIQSFVVFLIVMFVTFILPYFETGGILAPAYVVLQNHASPAAVRLTIGLLITLMISKFVYLA
ncbi:MAG: hypothetical protein B7W95_00070, partial [Acidimicrobiales bacterium 20-64-4]